MAQVSRVLALDFDGVVCDSVGESALSAWKARAHARHRQAGEALWPDLFKKASAAEKDRVVEEMRVVRPVVETGYENIVQVRILLERLSTPQQMLDTWGRVEMLPAYMQRWGLERGRLVDLFGSTRDAWMAEDLAGWLAPNRIYPGVADAVRAAVADPSADTSIVTTKQARFTHTILEELGGVKFDFDRIYSQTVSGRPKTEVLAQLAARAPAGARLIFVEDKYSTLEKVCATPGFEAWELYLVDWGYNTPGERAAAAANPRIRVVGVREFADILSGKWPPPAKK